MLVLWCLLIVSVKLWHFSSKFFSVVAEFLNFFCWHISEQGYCPLQVGVLGISVLMVSVYRELVGARNWNFHNRSWPLYLSYYHILLPVHIMPCLVYCRIVFSILKDIQRLTQWHVFTWTVQLWLWLVLPERMGNAGQNSVFLF